MEFDQVLQTQLIRKIHAEIILADWENNITKQII